jgi:diguanylate cyclase (GGDEF)-like protein/PAS domain S-box-containing protein
MPATLVNRMFPVRALGTVALGAMLLLIAGLVGVASPMTAVAVAVGTSAALPGAALVCLGFAVRATDHVLGACHCVGFLSLGVLASGLAVAVLPWVEPAGRQQVAAAGLSVAAAMFVVGLLRAPGVARTLVTRLRLALDGLCIGILLALVGWLLVPELGAHHPLAYASTTIAAACAAITVAAVLRARWQQPAMTRGAAGVALSVIGLALLVGMLRPGAPQWTMLVAALPVVCGPPLVWAGVRRVEFAPMSAARAAAAKIDESFACYPMVTLPVGAAVLAAGYHLLTVGVLDQTAVLLGMGAGAALAVREVLTSTDLRRRSRRLAAQEAHLRALVAGTGDVTMVLGDDLVVRWQSPAAHQLGLADEDVVGRRFTDLVHPNDAAVVADRLRAVVTRAAVPPIMVEARLVDGGGGWRETESTLSDLRGVPAVGALVVQVRDIGQRRHLERALHVLARTDQRTGLPNRRELMRAISARRSVGHRQSALLVIGLHGLTAVNDLRGRPAGDAVLVEAARRLRTHLGADDLAARLGESRFAVLTADGPIEAYALAVRLVDVLAGPYDLPGRPVRLQASAGLAVLSAGDSGEDVVHRGELALRRADQLGRDQVEWYDEGLEEQLVRRLDLERHLPGAAGRGELDLVYQPVVHLDGGLPVGVEALVRWRHAVLGRVLPGELMPVADRLRVSGEIGEWVLHTACRQTAAWRRDGYDLWLAVNVSGFQLADAEFVPSVAAMLSVHEVPPERLTIEISTAEIGEDLTTVASQLSKVRGLGVRTALDHVGAGHPDLGWLRRLPLDVVKLATPPAADLAGELATAVVELAGRLGLTVVAEGVETDAQLALVRAAGCRYGQGYLLSRPAPGERVEAYLETTRYVERPSAGPSSP